ncbi:MAG: RluA family pseudouridine synthase [Lachnospiraceae bacterium]|nr:RluA family pseudouridine synthase [Lachnospiraceae bacterium]
MPVPESGSRTETFCIDEADAGTRADKYLSLLIPDCSRSYIQKMISDGRVTVGEKAVKASYKLREDDLLVIDIPDPVLPDIEPENIALDILYEDDDVLVVNKPRGMVVHPAPGHYSGTLVNAVMYHCRDNLSSINGVMRPGIVHRIDKDTTGVLVVCKNDSAHRNIADQLSVHSITRKYRAIVYNILKDDEGTIDAPIGRLANDRKLMGINPAGRNAVTHYRVLERFGKYTYVECQLETGRTHQIRVHMKYIGNPLVGDTVYGPSKDPFGLGGQALHAMVLGFIHPGTGEYVEFCAPIPEYFEKLLKKLREE